MKTLCTESYETLKRSGHVVPRDKANYIIPFEVGKTYNIIGENDKTPIKVKCTQDCPYHLIIV